MILHPSVPRRWLYAFAGLIWMIVGLLLCSRAIAWLIPTSFTIDLIAETIGLTFGYFGYVYGFSKIVQKNILRIQQLPEHPCAFAFTAWYGYLMIAGMMTFGILLRNSSLPTFYLVIPYTTMGLMLLIGSVEFYHQFISKLISKK